MNLIRYQYPTSTGAARWGVGCIVSVMVGGQPIDMIYQWRDGTLPAAVLHYATGMQVATLTDDHEGYPQQRAQAAVSKRMAARWGRAVDPLGVIEQAAARRPRVNPEVYQHV